MADTRGALYRRAGLESPLLKGIRPCVFIGFNLAYRLDIEGANPDPLDGKNGPSFLRYDHALETDATLTPDFVQQSIEFCRNRLTPRPGEVALRQ